MLTLIGGAEKVKMQRKMGRLALYSVALMTAVTHVDN